MPAEDVPAEDVPAEARHLRLVVDSLASVQAGGPMDWVPPRVRLVTDQRPGSAVNLTPHVVKGLAEYSPRWGPLAVCSGASGLIVG